MNQSVQSPTAEWRITIPIMHRASELIRVPTLSLTKNTGLSRTPITTPIHRTSPTLSIVWHLLYACCLHLEMCENSSSAMSLVLTRISIGTSVCEVGGAHINDTLLLPWRLTGKPLVTSTFNRILPACTIIIITVIIIRSSSLAQGWVPSTGSCSIVHTEKNTTWPWPLTLKFNRVLHVHAKFHCAKCSGSWVMNSALDFGQL